MFEGGTDGQEVSASGARGSLSTRSITDGAGGSGAKSGGVVSSDGAKSGGVLGMLGSALGMESRVRDGDNKMYYGPSTGTRGNVREGRGAPELAQNVLYERYAGAAQSARDSMRASLL